MEGLGDNHLQKIHELCLSNNWCPLTGGFQSCTLKLSIQCALQYHCQHKRAPSHANGWWFTVSAHSTSTIWCTETDYMHPLINEVIAAVYIYEARNSSLFMTSVPPIPNFTNTSDSDIGTCETGRYQYRYILNIALFTNFSTSLAFIISIHLEMLPKPSLIPRPSRGLGTRLPKNPLLNCMASIDCSSKCSVRLIACMGHINHQYQKPIPDTSPLVGIRTDTDISIGRSL